MLQIVVQGYVDAITVATSLAPPDLPAPAATPASAVAPSPPSRFARALLGSVARWGKLWRKRRTGAGRTKAATGGADVTGLPPDRAAPAGASLFFALDH